MAISATALGRNVSGPGRVQGWGIFRLCPFAEHIQRVFELYKQYVYGGQRILGEMNRAQLGKLQAFYVRQGISQSAIPVDDLFTNEFVPGS